MRRFMSAIIIVAAAMVAVPSPSAGVDPPHFKGRVTNTAGDPVAGACVSIRQRYELREVTRACTDAAGDYATTAALSGSSTYYVHFSADGYVPQYTGGKPNAISSNRLTPLPTGRVVDAVLETQAGTLTGTLTGPDGKPVSYATVIIQGRLEAFTHTGVDGSYRFGDLPVGDYKVHWIAGSNASQWATGKVFETADTFTVTNGGVTTVSDQLTEPASGLPIGAVGGVVHDAASGEPVPGAKVEVVFRTDLEELGSATSGPDGFYRLAGLPTGSYRLRITAPGYAEQWNGPATSSLLASNLFVTQQDLTLHLPIFKAAAEISGQVLDPGGQAIETSLDLDGTITTGYGTFRPRLVGRKTAADGTYRFAVPPGTWKVRVFKLGLGSQWVHGKVYEPDATQFTLVNGQAVTVNEQFAARGVIELTILDEQTRAPVTNVCITGSASNFNIPQSCGGTAEGLYRLENLPPGPLWMNLTSSDHLNRYLSSVEVQSGQTLRRTLLMRATGSVTVPVAQAGAAVCVVAVPIGLGEQSNEDNQRYCSNDGPVTLSKVRAGKVNLFVIPADGVSGVQWVGVNGGTGDRREAAVIEVRHGQTSGAPQIRLDPAGWISGQITSNGSVGDGVWVTATPFASAPGLDYPTQPTQVGNSYSLGGLGPYRWPVSVSGSGVAGSWSGGATNRFDAALVKVQSGQISTMDVQVRAGATFVGIDLGATPPLNWSAVAYHSVTGDVAGSIEYPSNLGGLNTGPVFVALSYTKQGEQVTCWYTGEPVAGAGGRRGVPNPRLDVTVGQVYTGLRLIPGTTCADTIPALTGPPPRRSGVQAGFWAGLKTSMSDISRRL